MCCTPEHLGPPPEWQREYDGEVISDGLVPPSVSAAEGLNVLASVLHPAHQRGSGPGRGPRPRSTEGGQGRALLSKYAPDGRTRGRYEDAEDVLSKLADTDEPSWATRPRAQGLRRNPGRI
jgi:hypothetical protein